MGPKPPVELGELLSSQRWLESLARRLLGDSEDVGDVVQETLLAALRAPPRTPAYRQWLAIVAVNAVRALRRTDRNRRARERRIAPHGTAALPVDPLELEEMRHLVAQAVFELPEAHRDAILLVHYLSIAPAEAARIQDVSITTLYYRLRRGYSRLRRKLAASYGDGRGLVWLGFGAPVSNERSSSPATARNASRAVRSGSLRRNGAQRMRAKTRWRWAALCVCTLGALFVARFRALEPVVEKPGAAHSETSVRTGFAASAAREDASIPVALPLARPSEVSIAGVAAAVEAPIVPDSDDSLRIRVVDRDSQDPLAGATIGFSRFDNDHRTIPPAQPVARWLREPSMSLTVETDEYGEALAPRSTACWQCVWVRAPGYAAFRDPSQPRALGPELVVGLRRASECSVAVLDPNGRPAAYVPAALMDSAGGTRTVSTDDAGRVSFSWEEPAYALRMDSGGHEPVHRLLTAPRTVIRLRSGSPLRARVTDEDGKPVTAGSVTLRSLVDGWTFDAALDGDGFFDAPPLGEVGSIEVSLERSGARSMTWNCALPWKSPQRFSMRARTPSWLRVEVLAPDGSPADSATVCLYASHGVRSLPKVSVRTGAAGTVEFYGVPPGRQAVTVQHPVHGVHIEPVDVAQGEVERRLVIALPAAQAVSGRAVDPEGRPVVGMEISLHRPVRDTETISLSTVTDRDGRFSLPDRDRNAIYPVRSTFEVPADPWLDACTRCRGNGGWIFVPGRTFALSRLNGFPCPNDFVLVQPAEATIEVVVEFRPSHAFHLSLVDGGVPVRTLCKLGTTSRATGMSRVVPLGVSGDPSICYMREPLSQQTFCVIPDEYCLTFFSVPVDACNDVTLPLIPRPAAPRAMLLEGTDGTPLARHACYCTPIGANTAAFPRSQLGVTDEQGRLENHIPLAPGRYRFDALAPGEFESVTIGLAAGDYLPYFSLGEADVGLDDPQPVRLRARAAASSPP